MLLVYGIFFLLGVMVGILIYEHDYGEAIDQIEKENILGVHHKKED